MQIIFNQIEEAVHFCQQVQLCENCYQHVKQQQKRQQFVLQVKGDIGTQEIINAFQTVFNQYRLPQEIQQLIHKIYFFDKYNEVKEIFNYSITELRNDNLTVKFFSENEQFTDVVINFFKREVCSQAAISFNRVVIRLLERIRPFLIEVIGLAIEQWKSELQHDYFLSSVKQFISWQTYQTGTLHIVHENEFLYFKETGEKFEYEEISQSIKNSLIYSVGLSEDEWYLSPIIALAPKLIYIYSDEPSNAYLLTVKNLFQDRAYLLPKKLFPFIKGMNNNCNLT